MMLRFAGSLAVVSFLVGCTGSGDVSDLKSFVSDTLTQPRGRISPIPVFKPYEFFNYSAAGLRSPFDLPVILDTDIVIPQEQDNVSPDFDRPKEHLEQFSFGDLGMVGTMQGVDNTLWALVRDGDGGVVRIREGQYLGQNHGRVVSIQENRLNVIEIVPDGLGGWLERPRTLALDGIGEG
ncbi:pilus assembly protein PilP [Bacterioplanoides sp. SCSIO 12839]|uniref:pilus assembly protein PilP n=1 Tax=Bacterioplanoides sp. SCSIO 12839 TaxID=2829569 RepID=UPI00210298E4|nr:pilus assembly protein PilP [Bacterioplanoides sp. SCSIO 12839]